MIMKIKKCDLFEAIKYYLENEDEIAQEFKEDFLELKSIYEIIDSEEPDEDLEQIIDCYVINKRYDDGVYINVFDIDKQQFKDLIKKYDKEFSKQLLKIFV